MADARQSLRNIRITHFAFLGIPALLFFLLSTLHIKARAEPTFLPMVLAVLAVSEVGIATTLRGKLVHPAVEKLQRSPRDSAALEQWRRGNILSLVFALTVVLYGVMIRMTTLELQRIADGEVGIGASKQNGLVGPAEQ